MEMRLIMRRREGSTNGVSSWDCVYVPKNHLVVGLTTHVMQCLNRGQNTLQMLFGAGGSRTN